MFPDWAILKSWQAEKIFIVSCFVFNHGYLKKADWSKLKKIQLHNIEIEFMNNNTKINMSNSLPPIGLLWLPDLNKPVQSNGKNLPSFITPLSPFVKSYLWKFVNVRTIYHEVGDLPLRSVNPV